MAIVTGASRGIGLAIAKLFAAEGARVVCAARTLREGDHPLEGSLESTIATIRAEGGEAKAIPADISKEEDCNRLVTNAQAIYGPCDVLVNNAALNYRMPMVEYPTSRMLRTWAVNFHGPFILSGLVLRDMIPRRQGSIVNISSWAAIGPGRGPYPGPDRKILGTLYGAQKAALERFTQGLAQEVYEHGISVTSVAPSDIVPTPANVHFGLMSKDDSSKRGEPPEVMAKAVLLLATEPLDRVTGRVTYSQQILKEFGWIEEAQGPGVDRPGSGYSQI